MNGASSNLATYRDQATAHIKSHADELVNKLDDLINYLDSPQHQVPQNHTFSGGGYESPLAIHTWEFSLKSEGETTTLHIRDGHWGGIDVERTVKAHEGGWNELFVGAFKPYVERTAPG